jgi:formyltetrahydrofolate deformylase
MKPSAILLISCPDRKGEVATIADFVYRHGGNILHADEHADEESGLFLMRVEFDPKDFLIDLSQKDLADFGRQFSPIAEAFNMKWRLAQSSQRPRMIILVSKYDHCLVDLLYRHKSGELACDIPLIITPTIRRLPISTRFPTRSFQSQKTTRIRQRQRSSR